MWDTVGFADLEDSALVSSVTELWRACPEVRVMLLWLSAAASLRPRHRHALGYKPPAMYHACLGTTQAVGCCRVLSVPRERCYRTGYRAHVSRPCTERSLRIAARTAPQSKQPSRALNTGACSPPSLSLCSALREEAFAEERCSCRPAGTNPAAALRSSKLDDASQRATALSWRVALNRTGMSCALDTLPHPS
jgi:hypothetical protein